MVTKVNNKKTTIEHAAGEQADQAPLDSAEEALPVGRRQTAESRRSSSRATMTVDEVGEYLGVSRPVAYEMANDGTLPVWRIGRRIHILKDKLDEMLRAGTMKPWIGRSADLTYRESRARKTKAS